MPEVFGVEEDDGAGDVVPEHADHVLRQRQHLRQSTVVNPVSGTSQSAPGKNETKKNYEKNSYTA